MTCTWDWEFAESENEFFPSPASLSQVGIIDGMFGPPKIDMMKS